MAYVPVPKDLTKVKTKIAFNLTKRQIICFGLAAAIGVPFYLFTRETIGNTMAILLMIGLMMPFFFLAMFEKDGLSAENALRNMLRAKFWPSVRVYRTENLYKYLSDGGGDAAAGNAADNVTYSAHNGMTHNGIHNGADGSVAHNINRNKNLDGVDTVTLKRKNKSPKHKNTQEFHGRRNAGAIQATQGASKTKADGGEHKSG